MMIVGFVTRGRGVTIHRTDCVNVMNLSEAERVRLIDAEWQGSNLTSGLIRQRSMYMPITEPVFWSISQGSLPSVRRPDNYQQPDEQQGRATIP